MPTKTVSQKAKSTRTQANRTKRQASQTVRTAKNAADEATKQQAVQTRNAAFTTVERAVDTARTTVQDAGFAYVGAADATVAVVRELPGRAVTLRTTGVKDVTEIARREYDAFTVRGRTVVDRILETPATRQARQQTGAARHQVQTAAGQVRKAAEDTAEAVEDVFQALETAAGRFGVPQGNVAKLRARVNGAFGQTTVQAKVSA